MPNTFTPNNDGKNDELFPQSATNSSVAAFMIYNRWGEVMFADKNVPVNDPSRGWDGRYKGRELPPDVFVFVVEVLCSDGTRSVIKGDVALVR